MKRKKKTQFTEAKKLIVDELYKPVRKKFKRRPTVIKGLNDLWQIDLAEFGEYARENKGYKYVLVVIDCFSKFLYTRALKSKSGEEVSRAMDDILSKTRPPKHLQSDLGKEFYNAKFKAIMTKYGITHYSTYSAIKASMAERVIRTLKEKIYKAFNLRGTHCWIDILNDVTDEYNSTVHRTIKMRPKDVNKKNENVLLKSVYNAALYSHSDMSEEKMHKGDVVRISKEKAMFEKGYTPRWTTELFKIAKVQYTNPITYILEDMQGNPISGGFYTEELQKTNSPDIYLVEKVLRRKGSKFYVKWLGLSKEHNSWINSSDIK